MSNIAKALRAEISRLSRKEAKSAVDPIAKSNVALKKIVADLKGRIAALEKENKRLRSGMRKEKTELSPKPPDKAKKARLTSKGIRSLRNRLGLSQAAFAKLAGVTTHAVYLWETKDGALNLRENTRESLLSIKELGAKEAKEKLAETEKKSNATAPKE